MSASQPEPSNHLPFIDPALFQQAIEQIDAANAQDPNLISLDGQTVPYELFYSRTLSAWIAKLRSDASQSLQIAARCQHICRWKIPRSSYPEGRAGYLKWRSDLKNFHATTAGDILLNLGFPDSFIARIQALNRKQGLGQDDEVQTLEDGLCLMTLQYQLADLIQKNERAKLITVLQKTWRKMSAAGQAAALALEYPDDQKQLLGEALASATKESA